MKIASRGGLLKNSEMYEGKNLEPLKIDTHFVEVNSKASVYLDDI